MIKENTLSVQLLVGLLFRWNLANRLFCFKNRKAKLYVCLCIQIMHNRICKDLYKLGRTSIQLITFPQQIIKLSVLKDYVFYHLAFLPPPPTSHCHRRASFSSWFQTSLVTLTQHKHCVNKKGEKGGEHLYFSK